METLSVNSKKRKHALKQVLRENINKSKGFVKFCYVLTYLFRITAVVLGILNIIYVIQHDNPLALIFVILTFLFPWLFSFLPATVYIVSCGGEFRFRQKETIALTNDGFLYSYRDNRIGFENSVFVFHIRYDRIQRYEYNENTGCLTLYGTIILDDYKDGKLKASEEYGGIDLLNIFDVDLQDLVVKNCPASTTEVPAEKSR